MTKRFEISDLISEGISEMEGRNKIRVMVKETGKEILKALEKWGVMSQAQLEGLVFGREMSEKKRVELFFDGAYEGKFDGAGYKVLRRLRSAGLVRRHRFPNASVYTLTGRGHAFIVQKGISQIPGYRAGLAASVVPHEILVTAIGLTLSSIQGLRVSTEFERYALSRHGGNLNRPQEILLPDLWISNSHNPIVLEVERTLKSSDRYQSLWDDYRDLPRGAVVLYVTAFPGGVAAISSRAHEFMADFVHAASIEDFFKSLGGCPFVNSRGDQFRFDNRALQSNPGASDGTILDQSPRSDAGGVPEARGNSEPVFSPSREELAL